MKCPEHIDGFVDKLPKENKFMKYDFDEYHIAYLVKCKCGSEEFKVITNEMPSVNVKCNSCGREIIVYDLKFYPAATIIPGNEQFEEYVSPKKDLVFNVCVIYEYPEDYFNPNDISWCVIYVYGANSKEVFELLNDETA